MGAGKLGKMCRLGIHLRVTRHSPFARFVHRPSRALSPGSSSPLQKVNDLTSKLNKLNTFADRPPPADAEASGKRSAINTARSNRRKLAPSLAVRRDSSRGKRHPEDRGGGYSGRSSRGPPGPQTQAQEELLMAKWNEWFRSSSKTTDPYSYREPRMVEFGQKFFRSGFGGVPCAVHALCARCARAVRKVGCSPPPGVR